jgi:hypothetical protein
MVKGFYSFEIRNYQSWWKYKATKHSYFLHLSLTYTYQLLLLHALTRTGCPTIIVSNKKVLKRKQIRPLNQKRNSRRNSFIIEGNYRTDCKEWSIHDPLRSRCNKNQIGNCR